MTNGQFNSIFIPFISIFLSKCEVIFCHDTLKFAKISTCEIPRVRNFAKISFRKIHGGVLCKTSCRNNLLLQKITLEGLIFACMNFAGIKALEIRQQKQLIRKSQ